MLTWHHRQKVCTVPILTSDSVLIACKYSQQNLCNIKKKSKHFWTGNFGISMVPAPSKFHRYFCSDCHHYIFPKYTSSKTSFRSDNSFQRYRNKFGENSWNFTLNLKTWLIQTFLLHTFTLKHIISISQILYEISKGFARLLSISLRLVIDV